MKDQLGNDDFNTVKSVDDLLGPEPKAKNRVSRLKPYRKSKEEKKMSWTLEELMPDEGRTISLEEYDNLRAQYLQERKFDEIQPKSMTEAHFKGEIVRDFHKLLRRKNYKVKV